MTDAQHINGAATHNTSDGGRETNIPASPDWFLDCEMHLRRIAIFTNALAALAHIDYENIPGRGDGRDSSMHELSFMLFHEAEGVNQLLYGERNRIFSAGGRDDFVATELVRGIGGGGND